MNALKEHRHVLSETTMLQWFLFYQRRGRPAVIRASHAWHGGYDTDNVRPILRASK
jgi:hypothetical protein